VGGQHVFDEAVALNKDFLAVKVNALLVALIWI
jgi:hypothetical protein